MTGGSGILRADLSASAPSEADGSWDNRWGESIVSSLAAATRASAFTRNGSAPGIAGGAGAIRWLASSGHEGLCYFGRVGPFKPGRKNGGGRRMVEARPVFGPRISWMER